MKRWVTRFRKEPKPYRIFLYFYRMVYISKSQEFLLHLNAADGIFEKARRAVRNAKTGILESKEGVYGYAGGIILADSATFENNRVAIKYDPYSFYNFSRFKRCNFITSDTLRDGSAPDRFVMLNGVNPIVFEGCTFKNTLPSQWSYGMYLDACSGYHVENNEFYETSTSPVTIGLIVNNSGTLSNEIYRNTFHNLKIATLSQNENRNPDDDNGGLCYRCNKFIKNDSMAGPDNFDFAITFSGTYTESIGIAKNQGYLSGNTLAPAGNMFQPSPASSHYDFYNEGNPIDYYYHSQTLLPYRLRPRPENIYGTVNPIPVDVQFNENSCPSTLSGGGSSENIENLTHAMGQSDSIGGVLNALVDGGSTNVLNFDVATSTPPEALQTRNELIAKSPYLSDTVMKTSVAKQDVLDNAMIRDVLVANPHSAKSDEIINMLEDRINPMPDYMMEQILVGEDTVSALEILEAKKACWDGEATKAYTRLLNYFEGDSLTPANEDSLNWLFNYRNTISSQYDKAAWFHAKGDYSQSQSVLGLIPSTFNLSTSEQAVHEAYLDFFPLSEQIHSDTMGVFMVDSATVSSLQLIANSNTGEPAAYARNILIASGKITYQEPILLPDNNFKQAKKKFRGVNTSGDKQVLIVYPNPARDYFVVRFNLENFSSQILLTLYYGNGKIVHSHSCKGKLDEVIISTTNLKTGLYLLVLDLEGKHKECVKISVIK